jgi:hypothetical protein
LGETLIPEPASQQILSRNAEVISSEVGGQIALMSVRNGRYYSLNSIASDIWRKLENPTAIGRLADSLMPEYEGDAMEIERDLQETIEGWLVERLVILIPACRA